MIEIIKNSHIRTIGNQKFYAFVIRFFPRFFYANLSFHLGPIFNDSGIDDPDEDIYYILKGDVWA